MAYSDNNFSEMQQEALRRVREMQKRSRNAINPEPEQPAEQQPAPEPHTNKTSQNNNSPVSDILGNILGLKKGNGELFNLNGISIDEEKALIGILIYILYKQGSDVKLLLGLGYLLL